MGGPVSNAMKRFIGVVLTLCAVLVMAFWLYREQPSTLVVCDPKDGPDGENLISLKLVTKEFHPTDSQFAGSLAISAFPTRGYAGPDAYQKLAGSLKQVIVKFNRFENDSYVAEGKSDAPIDTKFPPAWGSLEGSGSFSWSANVVHKPFFYPFDEYVLSVNPQIMEVSSPDLYSTFQADVFQIDFGNTGFVPKLRVNVDEKPMHNRYEIVVQRPALLKTISVIVGLLLVFWLFFLMVYAKPTENAGQVVTLFVGVFSIRSSLLSGAPVFPSCIDYVTLGVYLAAVLLVLIRWRWPDDDTKKCSFCKSKIPADASVCSACTRDVAAA